MTAIDVFLREHAATHRRVVAASDVNADWLFEGLSETDWRVRPHGMNALAWLVWHMARVEDECAGGVALDTSPVWNAPWAQRLGVRADAAYDRPEDVAVLSDAVDPDALLAYRDAVGSHTREAAVSLGTRWEEPLGEADLARGVARGWLEPEQTYLVGRPREALVMWWGCAHNTYHLGQAAMLRSLGARAERQVDGGPSGSG